MAKAINLAVPQIINDLLRYPSENPITVDEKVADHLREQGVLLPDDGDGLDDKKVAELKQVAADEQIDLGQATAKPAIIEAIRNARAAKAQASE